MIVFYHESPTCQIVAEVDVLLYNLRSIESQSKSTVHDPKTALQFAQHSYAQIFAYIAQIKGLQIDP
jgi:hypothetical protein